MRKLMTYHPVMYRGMSYEQASQKAVEVCAVAAESGQTDLAIDHLVALAEVRRCVPPRTECLGVVESRRPTGAHTGSGVPS